MNSELGTGAAVNQIAGLFADDIIMAQYALVRLDLILRGEGFGEQGRS